MTSLAAVLLYQVSGWASAWTLMALVLCVLWVIAILETAGRRTVVNRILAREVDLPMSCTTPSLETPLQTTPDRESSSEQTSETSEIRDAAS